MSDIAVEVSHLWKKFRRGEVHDSLRDLVPALAKRLMGRAPRRDDLGKDDFWALRDVEFRVKQGEVLGIVGPNGAGKSTLLKLLSKIVKPTRGRIRVNGRLRALIEVAAGFHGDLTGRENIYLNGTILGMKKREIDRKFDEIVEFSGIAAFLDTPVKRYSSGMYARLGFAVAAHLDPEILLVDEILAVGDASYQRRCYDRMSALAKTGKTVLFVSHNMDIIPRLCSEAILLSQGKLEMRGEPGAVVQTYLGRYTASSCCGSLEGRPRTGDGRARFTRLELLDDANRPLAAPISGQDMFFRIEITASVDIPDAALALSLRALSGTRLLSSWTRELGVHVSLGRGAQSWLCRFDRVPLRPGHKFAVMLWMEAGGVVDFVEDAAVIEVVPNHNSMHLSPDAMQGAFVCDSSWSPA